MPFTDERTKTFVKTLFREYYAKADLVLPSNYAMREFALQLIDKEVYVRHLSFTSINDLRRYITDNVPLHLYYSSAKYREPANPNMEEKGWLGSDLVFDIDADHIPGCNAIEVRFCPSCGYVASGDEKKCALCGKELIEFDHVEPECIEQALEHVRKLVDVLEKDFGFERIRTAFSGHRGFHVVVELDGPDAMLPSEARREIIEYLKLSIAPVNELQVGVIRSRGKKVLRIPPRVLDYGVRRRVALELAKLVEDPDIREYILGRNRRIPVEKIYRSINDLNDKILKSLEHASIVVDEKVTIDTSRLIRIPNSINGKSGMIACEIDISSFELHEDLSPFNDMIIVVQAVTSIPKIRIFDEEIELKRGQKVVLSGSKALYLMLKGVVRYVAVKR